MTTPTKLYFDADILKRKCEKVGLSEVVHLVASLQRELDSDVEYVINLDDVVLQADIALNEWAENELKLEKERINKLFDEAVITALLEADDNAALSGMKCPL